VKRYILLCLDTKNLRKRANLYHGKLSKKVRDNLLLTATTLFIFSVHFSNSIFSCAIPLSFQAAGFDFYARSSHSVIYLQLELSLH
jgi:hypothetical protein